MNRIIVCILFLSFVSCQEEELNIDTFEKYYGQYECLRETFHFDFFESYSTHDTITIIIQSYPSDKRILIHKILVDIEEDGYFKSYHEEPQNPYGCGTTYGNFYSDSIYIYQPDMWCESSVTYKGKKINL